ncbi:MAG: NUDIX domain-containing protein [Alphaproteobacteria bacterium]|jgi:8-oxo-dGTP pyrophosphatase MutT (NUDIX family)|nr:NUDIX domain-containing protein [Alphaproteobacteria bacterium]
MSETTDKAAIRDAATIILLRHGPDGPAVLMGQRGTNAAFMPDKFVFPGGALDATDAVVPVAMPEPCRARMAQGHANPDALAAAAIREMWEETGLMMGLPGDWADPPADWAGFAAHGLRPSANGLRFIFRAITPPGRPRRFDARFFLADAGAIAGDLDDFSAACEELSHLHWVPLADARKLNLPFITEVVLAEVQAMALGEDMPGTVPFFDNSTGVSTFRRIA